MPYKRKLDTFSTLVDIIARLRGLDGCPWDKEQTHLSLKPNLLEECYEALEAIDEGDDGKLCEELGDILMQIALHSQIGQEDGQFNVEDVLRSINTKLIRRHPHVFGTTKVSSSQDVIQNWEAIKQEEKGTTSVLDGLPKGMPALAYSQAMQRRAARVGFDWKEIEGVIDKLVEEVEELRKSASHEERVREFGDVLFALVNVARRLDVESEEALQLAGRRFRQRFQLMEEDCRRRGIVLSSLPLEEQDKLWEQAKERLSE
ncbi:MAG: nucleoside triphosphate pyrophosphohydrolase [Dehalococcoidia bacterium]|nr:nucleoside triphosphate pyrophosphohydrolase [Dehalococcoidia bacterium]